MSELLDQQRDLYTIDYAQFTATLGNWVETHPDADVPMLGWAASEDETFERRVLSDIERFNQPGMFSPRDIAEAVRLDVKENRPTELSRNFLKLIENGLKYASFEQILDSFCPAPETD